MSVRKIATRMCVIAIAGVGAETACAQMPGVPVLQSGWITRDAVGALSLSGGPAIVTLGVGGSWRVDSSHVELSAGAGWQNGGVVSTGALGGGVSVPSRPVVGTRIAVSLDDGSSRFGVVAFTGIGGGLATRGAQVSNPGGSAGSDSVAATTQIPVGVGLGWRQESGSGELSVYATPSLTFITGGGSSSTLVRVGFGISLGPLRGSGLGANAGVEIGSLRAATLGGPSGTLFSAGLSYTFGDR